MKTQKLQDFMNIDNFISIVMEKLKEKPQLVLSTRSKRATQKLSGAYYINKDFERTLKYVLRHS
jgi:hypothetical protein